jgi:hypothetical protein
MLHGSLTNSGVMYSFSKVSRCASKIIPEKPDKRTRILKAYQLADLAYIQSAGFN